MLLRIFLFVLFLGLVYRVFRDLLRSSLRWAFTSRDGSRAQRQEAILANQ